MIIIGYLIVFLFLMWLGQKVCIRCVRHQRKGYAFLCMTLVILMQAVVIYYFVGTIIDQMTTLLKLFYNET
ncbi:hypothetical protein C7J88_09000 [Staphylococcus muscae]|uniref:Transmembrane protein n=1 Tax=Staphylococcus muscae TaxID=1294 RepID=A0A240BYX3_9STAP|nr:hypothetical protein C7J88_09000 [Staphylococcus muscae]GGA84499.1 hypothetical protein GCM10007183_05830 [Staphylococcus muscae]SNW00058.1 Uncharacterised protein [Staphylococcus muscae]